MRIPLYAAHEDVQWFQRGVSNVSRERVVRSLRATAPAAPLMKYSENMRRRQSVFAVYE
jgi:hypothetical protein